MDSGALHTHSVAILKELVGFNSTSHLTNLPIIDHIESYLQSHGAVTTRVLSPEGNKSNLLARLGPDVAGGIVLSGHTDVVPVEGQDWDTDPFTLTEKAGKLYGRGSCDMKGFIAVCMAFAPEFAKLKLKKPIYFAFSYDEEIGCVGVAHLLQYVKQNVPMPEFAIIGEPTMMQVVSAHKGVLSFMTTVTGREWHSSQPHYGVNAVQIGCELVHFLTDMARELQKNGMRDERFDPPYSTVHTGIIHGGTARNIIPKECYLNWEIRPLPGEDTDALFRKFTERCEQYITEMKKIYADADIVTRPVSRMLGVTLPAHATSAAQLVKRCAVSNREHAVSFGTEAGIFNEYGIPAIVCGPGNIEQAHKPNEFIDSSQLKACVEFMIRLTDEVI